MLALALFVVACVAEGGTRSERSVITTAANGLRTFTVVRTIDGAPATCGAMLASEPHVTGVLAGDPGARPEPIWLVDHGRRISIVWPEGFEVRFEPHLALYDEGGRLKARAGQRIEFNQSARDHAGTYDDPYMAVWFLGDANCYLYRP